MGFFAIQFAGCTTAREEQTMEINNGLRVPPPMYPQVEVEATDELLEWLRIVEAETFQSGRYEQVMSLLRAGGQANS